jgi:PAS domain-containing protein
MHQDPPHAAPAHEQAAPPQARMAVPEAPWARLAADARFDPRVLDQLPVGVVLSGRQLTVEHVNATLTRQLGWTAEAVRGQLDGAFLCHPADAPALAGQMRAMVGAPGELQARFTARQCDGHALVLLDDSGRVLSWNAGATHVFGHTPVRAMGCTFDTLFDSDARVIGLPQRLLQQALAAGRVPIDGPVQHASGRRLHAAGSLYARPPQAWPAAFALLVRGFTAQQATAVQIFGRRAATVLVHQLLPENARQAHGLAIKRFLRSGKVPALTARANDAYAGGRMEVKAKLLAAGPCRSGKAGSPTSTSCPATERVARRNSRPRPRCSCAACSTWPRTRRPAS